MIAGAVYPTLAVIAPPDSIWQAGEPIGVCPDDGVERKQNVSGDAGGTSQTPPPYKVISKGDAPDRRRSESVSGRSPAAKVRALSANSSR